MYKVYILTIVSTFTKTKSNECSIYLAESGIPNAGFGVYTTKPFTKGEIVSNDLAIPLTDVMRNLGPEGEYIHWTHDDYNWRGDWENEYITAEKVSMNAFPIGALTNFHTFLHCVSPTSHIYDDSLLDRTKDVGVGAFSYHQRIFTATRNITAGEELFSNYGENWLDSHHFDDVPRKKNFRRAHRILEELAFRDIHDKRYIDTLSTIVGWYDKRTASLLGHVGLSIQDLAISTIQTRSLDWIRHNGKCLDAIYGDKSTIPQAGRGAFAKRFIPKGDLIIPMPLLQIMNKTNMTMYATNHTLRDTTNVIGHHLLMNYCFSHPQSSLLLCPSTHGGLINHSLKPNAIYKWADWDPTTKQWLNMTYAEMNARNDKGLTFDIIALTDIQPNEEIFIDYGPLWQQAWQQHTQTFTTIHSSFRSTFQMNNEQHPLYTIEQLQANSSLYPSNVMNACEYYEQPANDDKIPFLSDYDESVFWNEFRLEKEKNSSVITIQDFLDSYQHLSIAPFSILKDVPDKDLEYWPCRVILRTNELYTVQIYQSPAASNTQWTVDDEFRFVTDVPRDRITFVNKPYASDMFLDGVFRHTIGIRDDLVPEGWRDLK